MIPTLGDSNPLVLGSGSPRRREILQVLGIPYVVRKADADETWNGTEAPGAYLERVVAAKLAAVRSLIAAEASFEHSLVLVADTAVVLGSRILGKPESVADAAAMVTALSGREHLVMTRFALAEARDGREPLHAETVTTTVRFRALDAGEADGYAASREGLDKAGAYAIQGLGAAFVASIEGSYSSVVGLPACELVVALRRLGIAPSPALA